MKCTIVLCLWKLALGFEFLRLREDQSAGAAVVLVSIGECLTHELPTSHRYGRQIESPGHGV